MTWIKGGTTINLGERVLPYDDSDPSEERGKGRRESILRAALDVFARRGFHQANLDEIAKVAGVGKGTIYLYVPDKEGLLLEAITHAVAVHERNILEEVTSKSSALEQLYQIIYLEYKFLLTNVDLAKLLYAERTALGFSETFEDAMASLRRRRKELVTSIMREGQKNGELRADVKAESLAISFMGIEGGLVFDILFDDGPRLDPHEAAREFLDLFLQGAGPAPEEGVG